MAEREILVIDDDPIILMIHQAVLESAVSAISCQYFEDARNALLYMEQSIGSDKKFLLFLDINMPLISGWDLLEAIENSVFKENVFVIMATSSVNEGDKIKAGNYRNIYDFISKPLREGNINELKKIEEIKPFLI